MKTFDNSAKAGPLSKIACAVPFSQLHIYFQGNVTHCCPTWLPTYLGNVNTSTLLEMLNNDISKEIQESVIDSTFSFCSAELCPKLSEYVNLNRLVRPIITKKDFLKINRKKITIFMDYDPSCNLFCGSCRNDRILYTEETAPKLLKQIHKNVQLQVNELIENDYEVTLHLTGSGDPFASPLYWSFLKEFAVSDTSRIQIEISTNGTLMTRERLLLPYAQRIKHFGISVDAATETTYKIVRRGGSFPALIQNLQNLDSMVERNELQNRPEWIVNFVVQSTNYSEMADFAKWILSSYKTISRIWFNLIADWEHLEQKVFLEKAVWREEHPEHKKFLEVLNDPVFDHPKVLLGNVAPYRNKQNTKLQM